MTDVWSPIKVANMQLPHRLAMAPMTRSRAMPDGTPGDLASLYYAQRAGMGLLITEGTQPSADGRATWPRLAFTRTSTSPVGARSPTLSTMRGAGFSFS